MKSPIPDLVKKSREDLSSYVWHFCREDDDPRSAIGSILREKRIRAGLDRDTKTKVVSFTEAPLEQMRKQAPILREERFPRFSLFGIGFKKEVVFRHGCLPGIYQPRKGLHVLPDSIKWRHIDLDLGDGKGIDYSWMREWRVNTDFDFAGVEDEAIVVAPDIGELEDIVFTLEEDGDVEDGEPQRYLHVTVWWNFISLESMESPINDAKIKVACRQKGNRTLHA